MKKFTLLAASLCAAMVSFGQTWSDDFESYTVGDFLGVAGAANGWTTWSAAPGSAEDILISDADAQSGSNSIFFDGAPGGGPHDVVLDFGAEYSSGRFHLDMAIKTDSGFYFNLQGNSAIGTSFPLQVYLIDDSVGVDDGTALYANVEFLSAGQWATVSVDVDLDNNVWSVSWDGTEIANFENANNNQVAGMDIFPLDGEFDFYIDDVNWSYTPSSLVTFKVDMNYYTAGTFTTPEVNGTYNGWCGACNPLADGDGDGIWEGTFLVTADSIEYKFAYDNWTGQESLTAGSACTKTTGEFTNRFLMLDGTDLELDVVCWEQCIECAEPAGVNSLKGAAGVSVYPNPATDLLTIEFGEEASEMTIAIVDVMGRPVMPTINQFSGNRTEISVNDLPQGAYFITGTSEGYSFKKSIMITK
jgi:hypothetical protein